MKWRDIMRRIFGGGIKRSLEGGGPLTMAELEGLFASPSKAGQKVNEDTAMNYAAVFAAVKVLAESIAALPLIVYERVDDGKKRATEHPVYRLLHDTPNPSMTPAVLKETMQGHIVTWGNGYAKIVTDTNGEATQIWPLSPRDMRIKIIGNRPYYSRGQDSTPIDSESIIHIPGLGFDGVKGYSMITKAKEAIGLGLAMEEFGAKLFANGIMPGGALEHPGKLTPAGIKNLRNSFLKPHEGASKAWKPLILEDGLKWQQIGIPPEDAQFLESRKFQITEIARIYRVPPHLLGDLEKATFSNIEQQSLEFVKYTLKIWIVKWEQELNRKLFKASERGKYFVEFLIDDLLRADIKTRYQAYRTGIQGGFLTPNEVRARENLMPIKGGNNLFMQVNMSTLDTIAKDNNGGDNNGGQKED